MTATHEQRITDLESETFRIGHRFDRLAGGIEHLTNGLGDLSQDQRALAFDVREIKGTLAGHGARLERIEQGLTEHGTRLERIEQGLTEHGTRLEGIEQGLTEHGTRLEGIEQALTGHGDLLRAILNQLGSEKPPSKTPNR